MNNIHSDLELIYKKRLIGPQVLSAINSFPVVAISGARQVGKSTFLLNEFSGFKYISLDDFSTLKQAKIDPLSLWLDNDRVIIDEAQKAPEIFTAIKSTIDRGKKRKKFLISGSSNLLLMKGITETLAGRAVYFEMMPMLYGEIKGETEGVKRFSNLWNKDIMVIEERTDFIDPIKYMLQGFMPPLIHLNELKSILLWWEGYVRTYIERDVRELSQIESLIDFRKVLDSIALRTGNILNQTEIARETGISQPTVYRYLKLLEVSNIIKRIPAYSRNRNKRIIKSPKIFLIDPALSIYLSGYYEVDSLRAAREIGGFFETMCFLHLNVLCETMTPKARVFYWRTTTGKEVDFVIEHGKKLLAFEVKLTKNPSFNDIKNLLAFMQEYPQFIRGILIHAGDTIKWLHSKILAVPWWWIG